MVGKELELIGLLEEETKEKVLEIVAWSEILLDDTPYRLSLPGYGSGHPTLRTAEDQWKLYLIGRPHLRGGTKGRPVTWVDGKNTLSYHQSGKAIDIGLRLKHTPQTFLYLDDCDAEARQIFLLIVDKFKALGFEWGGDWSDAHKDWNHFQR